jgi:hypothetical protein
MTITFEPRKVAIALGTIIIILVFADLGGLVFKYFWGHDYVFGFIPLFDLNNEQNIPTLFSTVLLLLGSGLSSIIAISRKSQSRQGVYYWIGLALIFLFLSIDEFAMIHECLVKPLRTSLNTSGLLYYPWVIVYGPFVAIIGLIYLRFVISLPKNIRRLIFCAGLVYITGAVGFECISGWYEDLHHGQQDIVYEVLAACEESLEMVGILIFVYALLCYIDTKLSPFQFRITSIHEDKSPSKRNVMDVSISNLHSSDGTQIE